MEKKLFHGIIAAVIFIALVIGVNLSTGFTAVVAVIALVLHSRPDGVAVRARVEEQEG